MTEPTLPTSRKPFDNLDLNTYRNLLGLTTKQYNCVGFEVVLRPDLSSLSFCIVRHDIDMDPTAALPVARVEAELGVRATYMVLLTSEFYNAFDRVNTAALRELVGLGHDIGLHFDAEHHAIRDEGYLEESMLAEADMLRNLVLSPVNCFSFHNTTPFTMGCRQLTYAGLLNAYAGPLQDHVSYVSDSNGFWRFGSWQDRLNEAPQRLQVLTHPEFWQPVARHPGDHVARLIDSRAEITWQNYCDLLLRGGRANKSSAGLILDTLVTSQPPRSNAILRQWLAGRQAGALADLAASIIADNKSLIGAPSLARALATLAEGRNLDEVRAKRALIEGVALLTGRSMPWSGE